MQIRHVRYCLSIWYLGLSAVMGTATTGLAAGTTGKGAASANWLATLSGTAVFAAYD